MLRRSKFVAVVLASAAVMVVTPVLAVACYFGTTACPMRPRGHHSSALQRRRAPATLSANCPKAPLIAVTISAVVGPFGMTVT